VLGVRLLHLAQLLLGILLDDLSGTILLVLIDMLLLRFFNRVYINFHVFRQGLLVLLLFLLHVSFSGARLRHLHRVAADAKSA
jgi:hypothetical protein